MKRWQIRNRRDWGIAVAFLLLLSYLLAVRYQWRINEWMMGFSPEKMTSFNQPDNYGTYVLAVLFAALSGTCLWIWQRWMSNKKILKGIVAIWVSAILLCAVFFIQYQGECRQIVNMPRAGLEPRVTISIHSPEVSSTSYLELTGKEKENLVNYCLNMEALPKEMQRKCREQALKNNQDNKVEEETISVIIFYPKYQNHHYSLNFRLEGDYFYLIRGHSVEEGIFYNSEEARERLEKIISNHRDEI